MRAPISVIIPTFNAAKTLPACLSALFEGLEAGLIRELVVSDGGSGDATCEIADEAGAVLVHGEASRGGQLKRAGEVARGEWLLIVHADTHLGEGWSDAVAQHISQNPTGEGAGYGCLCFDAPGVMPRLVAGWANLRSKVLRLPYGDQGLLISRKLYEQVGGFEDIPLMEDVSLARRLKSKLHPLPIVAQTSAARYRDQGWLRRGARNLWLVIRYLFGADPVTLARAYRRDEARSTSLGS